MRVISGKYRGRRISVPAGFRARPTTDFAREGLFNILSHRMNIEDLRVLDLFGGTGSISLEFASRGAAAIDYVEKDHGYCEFVKKTISGLGIQNIRIHNSDVFRFLKYAHGKFDVVFADPPYDLSSIPELPGLITERNILVINGWFILEHGRKHKFNHYPGFLEVRTYGNVHFSIFTKQ